VGDVEGGTYRGEVGVVKDVAFGVEGVAQAHLAVVEASVAILYVRGEPVVAEGDVALVGTHEDGAHLGGGVLAPVRDVVGKVEEALIPRCQLGRSFS
jgi:hypothetical protein